MKQDLNQRFQELMMKMHSIDGALPPFERYQITRAQMTYLDYIAQHEGCSLSDLATALSYTAASASAMVTSLEDKELVTKKTALFDARSIQINLTPTARQLMTEVEKFRRKRMDKLLQNLDATEQATLINLLEKAMKNEEK